MQMPPASADPFQPRGNVDTVSEQVSCSDHNVAHMHANAVVDAAAWFERWH